MAQDSSARVGTEAGATASSQEALPAIDAWLALMDHGDYGGTWETASADFHSTVPKQDWVSKGQSIRKPLGSVISRKLTSKKATGDTFVATYDTSFAKFRSAKETVEFTREKDGSWKAASYLIEPGTGVKSEPSAKDKETALEAMKGWLSLMDSGQYDQSWTAASAGMKKAVSQEEWAKESEKVRKPLGKVISRKLTSAKVDGTALEATYDTSFEGLKSATETVTFTKEEDGQWRAAGYYIQPGESKREPASASEKAAVDAAQIWLAEIDAGNYSQSWKDAGAIFQGAITESAWVAALDGARKPLGALMTRKLKSAHAMSSLPGAPDGAYVLMQFDTSFANKGQAVETVTFMLEKDGKWRGIGYFVK